jgi:hypothetical protein
MQRPIQSSATAEVPFAKAREVVLDDLGALFGDVPAVHVEGVRVASMDLGVTLGAGASVHQAVALRVAPPRALENGLILPLSWRASGHDRLLPTFEGELEISKRRSLTRVRLAGTYTVPLGLVGRVGDGVVGWRVARRSIDALVERVARRLESAVRSRAIMVDARPDRGIVRHPEIYVG